MKTMGLLKALKEDEVFTFPDGTTLTGRDVVEPSVAGRKVVILGDTCDSSAIESIARDATVLVHEATNSHFPELDKNSASSYQQLEVRIFICVSN
jgi:ribonuclease Z